MSLAKEFSKGFIKENPVFVLLLGMCPTLGVTSSGINGLGMGLATTVVLIASNVVISLVKPIIPDKVRIPAFIIIIATFVTVIELLMKGFLPSLYETLGLFIPLIVVNCLILGRAEGFASKNSLIPSLVDGAGMGLGFTFALTLLGTVREVLGNGSIFDFKFVSQDAATPLLFVLAPGAFIVLGVLIAGINNFTARKS